MISAFPSMRALVLSSPSRIGRSGVVVVSCVHRDWSEIIRRHNRCCWCRGHCVSRTWFCALKHLCVCVYVLKLWIIDMEVHCIHLVSQPSIKPRG